ncbi:MAG: hypothetical protein WCC52_03595 [Nitrosotalea sp.]
MNGTINNLISGDTKVTIVFTLPDSSTKGSKISANNDGTFETSLPLDSNSQNGAYSVSATYGSTPIGALAFTVKQIPVHIMLTTNMTNKVASNSTLKESITTQRSNITKIIPSSLNQTNIPIWIKNTAKWWSHGQVGDADYIRGIQYMVQQGLVQVPMNSSLPAENGTHQIPSWVRNNAAWWSEGMIGDSDFVKGIDYLVQNGIISLQKTTQTTTQPITEAVSQPVNSTQALFPQQTDLGDGWIVGNLTLSTEQGNEWLEDWYQSYTNNYDNKKIHVEIAKYESSDKAQQSINSWKSMKTQGSIAITPDNSIKNYCWEGDRHMGGDVGPLSTTFFCQKDEYTLGENPIDYDNSDQVKQDMTKLAQIILNKLPNETSVQSISNAISQPQATTQSDLMQLFPTYSDGLTWSMDKEKDISYNAVGNETVDAYQREYVKSQDMGSGVIDVSIYRFGSNDESKQKVDEWLLSAQSHSQVGFSTLGNLPSECQGIMEDFGLEERTSVYCNKNNYFISIGGVGSLYNLGDEAINFANMILAKIS